MCIYVYIYIYIYLYTPLSAGVILPRLRSLYMFLWHTIVGWRKRSRRKMMMSPGSSGPCFKMILTAGSFKSTFVNYVVSWWKTKPL